MCENLITNTRVEFTIFFQKKEQKKKQKEDNAKFNPCVNALWVRIGA